MHTKFCRFAIFWAGSSLCLAYLATMLISSGIIRWGEDGARTVAYLCIILMFLDLLFLLEYMLVLYEDEEKRGDE